MENENTEFVYLTRVLKAPYTEYLEDYLMGNPVSQLGKPSSAVVPSSIESRLDLDCPSAVENARKTSEISSYFFYGPATEDGLVDLKERTNNLLYSPASETAVRKQDLGIDCNADELYGGDILSMLILKVPMEILEVMANMGLAELRKGEYGKDSERVVHDEIAIGDDGLRALLSGYAGSEILAYDEFHKVLNNPRIFSDATFNPFDANGLFDSSYRPEITIDKFPKVSTNKNASKSRIESELSDAELWLKEHASELSEEDRKIYESALRETAAHYNDSTDDDLPTA